MGLTWRMANLCISPEHAGIMLLRTANSSFILDLLLLSIKLWAVFLAIFLPAALVAEGCFLLDPAAAAVVVGVAGPLVLDVAPAVALAPAAEASAVLSLRGFICMILRFRVGGGGRAKS